MKLPFDVTITLGFGVGGSGCPSGPSTTGIGMPSGPMSGAVPDAGVVSVATDGVGGTGGEAPPKATTPGATLIGPAPGSGGSAGTEALPGFLGFDRYSPVRRLRQVTSTVKTVSCWRISLSGFTFNVFLM